LEKWSFKFESILGSEKQFYTETKWNFRFRTVAVDRKEIGSTEDLGNRNALGFHIPKMWDKILDINKCHLQEDPSNAIRNEVRILQMKTD
jgi:23S rRNA (uracil1939-C5)-methyltransferase